MLARVGGLELSEEHAIWLEDVRKIPSEIAAEMGVRSSGKRIVFEYDGFRKFRTPDKMFWIEPAGAALRLWNERCLNEESSPETPLVITEGEFDACAWMTAGATHVVSVPNGGAGKPGEGDIVPSEDRQFAYLWDGTKLRPGLERFNKIILATDNDPAGLILRDELAIRLGRDKCWYVAYPDGCKDANDVLVKFDSDKLTDVLCDAKPIVPNRLVKFSEIPEAAQSIRYSSGWSGLDRHLMLVPPELVVVTGAPGSGKSQWTLAWCANLARLHGLRGAILQFEDRPDRNRSDLIAYASAWHGQERGGIQCSPREWVDRMFRAIPPSEDDGEDFTLDWLKTVIEEAARRHSCKWVLIDPWNEIEHVWKVNESETGYTNQALRELKKLSRRLKVTIIIVAHPSKSGGQHKNVDDTSMYDISGSAAWKNKADHGIIIFREDTRSTDTLVKIDKSKDFARMGVRGTVRMRFNPAVASFEFVGSES